MTDRQSSEWWRLTGTSLQVTWFATIAFLGAGVLALALDILVAKAQDAPAVQAWTLVPQVVCAVSLLLLWRRSANGSFLVLAALLVMIIIEEAFHVLNQVQVWLKPVARWAVEWSGLSLTLVEAIVIYTLVAVVGFAMIWVSYRRSCIADRPVVRNLAVLLVAGGLFGGPGNAFSVYVEELGEAVVFAVLAGYAAGLAARSRVLRQYQFPGRVSSSA